MGKKNFRTTQEIFGKLQDVTFGGAAVVKSTDVLKHARDPTALAGDIEGLTGVGIGSAFGKAAFDFALKPVGLKKRKRR